MQTRICRAINRLAGLTALVCFAAAWTTAQADVTIKQKTTSEGLGGFLNSEMTIETMISGDKECENAEVKMDNKLMAMFGATEPIQTSTITRLDKDLIWELMHQQEQYTEEKLSDKKARMERFKEAFGGEDMENSDASGISGNEDVDWGPPKFSVDNTGKSETIAGHKCDQSIVAMEMEGTHKETGEKVKLHLTMDLFLAKDVTGLDEMKAFGAKKAQAMGEEKPEDESPAFGMMEMLQEFGVDSDELVEKAKALEGYPFRMTIEMTGEGAQFDRPSGMSEEDEAKMEEAMEAMKSLGGLFGADDSDEADETADSTATEVADGPLFKVTTEVMEYSTGSVAPAAFDLPANYKKTSMDDVGGDTDMDGDE